MVEKNILVAVFSRTKVYYEESTKTTKNEGNWKITESKFKEAAIDDSQYTNVATQLTQATQSSQESWWCSWSGLSQPFTSKGEKRDLSDDEEEQ